MRFRAVDYIITLVIFINISLERVQGHLQLIEVTDDIKKRSQEISSVGDWKDYLIKSEREGILGEIRKRNLNGLPLGEDCFLQSLAERLGKKLEDLKPKSNGRPRKR